MPVTVLSELLRTNTNNTNKGPGLLIRGLISGLISGQVHYLHLQN
jgi:hypothetical protein